MIIENNLCGKCGEVEDNNLHHDESPSSEFDHYAECNHDVDYQGEETGWVETMDCHEYEPVHDDVTCGCKGKCQRDCPCMNVDCIDDDCGGSRGCNDDCTCSGYGECD